MTDKMVSLKSIKTVEIVCDGGCRGNGQLGAHAYGSFAVYVNGEKVHHFSNVYDDGLQTNNVAEYKAFIDALFYMQSNEKRRKLPFTIKTDSSLVYGQLKLEHKVKAQHLVDLYNRVKFLMAFLNVEIVKVPREYVLARLGH